MVVRRVPQPQLVKGFRPRVDSTWARGRFRRALQRDYLARIGDHEITPRLAFLVDAATGARWDLHRAELQDAPPQLAIKARQQAVLAEAALTRAIEALDKDAAAGSEAAFQRFQRLAYGHDPGEAA